MNPMKLLSQILAGAKLGPADRHTSSTKGGKGPKDLFAPELSEAEAALQAALLPAASPMVQTIGPGVPLDPAPGGGKVALQGHGAPAFRGEGSQGALLPPTARLPAQGAGGLPPSPGREGGVAPGKVAESRTVAQGKVAREPTAAFRAPGVPAAPHAAAPRVHVAGSHAAAPRVQVVGSQPAEPRAQVAGSQPAEPRAQMAASLAGRLAIGPLTGPGTEQAPSLSPALAAAGSSFAAPMVGPAAAPVAPRVTRTGPLPSLPEAPRLARQEKVAIPAMRLDRSTGTVQTHVGGEADSIQLATPMPAPAPTAAPRQEPHQQGQREPERKEIRQVETTTAQEPRPVGTAHGPAPDRTTGDAAAAAEANAPLPAGAIQEEFLDPGLQLRFVPGGARIAMQTPGTGELTVQLDVREGVADLKVGGAAAWLLGAHTDELRVALAQEGLTLGRLEQKDAQGFGPGGDRPTSQGGGEGRDEPTGRRDASPQPSPSPSPTVARRTGSGRHHVEA